MKTINDHSILSSVRGEFGIKKLILILILIACLVFIFFQKDNFLIGQSYFNGEQYKGLSSEEVLEMQDDNSLAKTDTDKYGSKVMPKSKVSLKGSHTVTQTFTAEDSKINNVNLVFNNPKNYTADGSISVKIFDKSGKKICDSSLDANLIANDSVTRFDFNGNTEKFASNKIVTNKKIAASEKKGIDINKGDTYTISITSKNISSDAGFSIYLGDQKYTDSSTLKVDGRDMGQQRLFSVVRYLHFNIFVFATFTVATLLAILFILLPIGRLGEMLTERRRRKGKKTFDLNVLLLRIIFVATPFAAYFMISKSAGARTLGFVIRLFSLPGLLNMALIGAVWWLLYTILNRTKETAIFTMLVSFVFAFANYMLIQFRDCPLMATDFASIGTAKDVAASYTLVFGKSCLWAIMLTAIFCCITASLRTYKGLALKKRLAVLIVLFVWCGSFTYMVTSTQFLNHRNIFVSGFNPKSSYHKYGYALSFVITVNGSHIKKPSGYSVSSVKDITSKYKSDKVKTKTKTTTKSPNVIVIMNESFSDLKAVGDFKTSGDYMPFYHSLKKNTIKGYMHTSVFGGGTADTEFEFLTGNTMQFIPFRSIPYNNMIKTSSPSFTQNLKSSGYTGNIAFHPGMSTSYNRSNVYPLLGFSKFISLEDLKNPDYLRSYVSDKYDFKQIEKYYTAAKAKNSNSPFYMFNVTIQNHAAYKVSDGVVQKEVSITDDNAREEQAEQYINLIKKSDEALEQLITYYKKVDQPTVIVMFGDHQPRVGDSFYNSIYGKSSSQLSLKETEKKYHVPVMIWANYSIKSKSNLDISANYLSSYLAKVTNQQLTGYNKYLLDLYKKVPVVTSICYKGANGKTYDLDQKSKYTKYLNEYKKIQYNNLVDYKNRVGNFFYLAK